MLTMMSWTYCNLTVGVAAQILCPPRTLHDTPIQYDRMRKLGALEGYAQPRGGCPSLLLGLRSGYRIRQSPFLKFIQWVWRSID
jgi:hypothetical protein